MGIALSNMIFWPAMLRTCLRRLQRTSVSHTSQGLPSLQGPSAAPIQASAQGNPPQPAPSPPAQRPRTASPGLRPLRGNWPFTAALTPPDSSAGTPAPTGKSSCCEQAELLRSRATAVPGHSVLKSSPRQVHAGAVKGVRRATAAEAGRLVIAGRMADVCAELDRMVASEAALRAC